jgi:hypothetical protein
MHILSIKSYITDLITETKYGKIRTVHLKTWVYSKQCSIAGILVCMIWKVTFAQILTMMTKKMSGMDITHENVLFYY